MGNLARQIEEAKANLSQLEQAAKHASCRELGHDWHSIGGKNAGCGHPGCSCSVPVMECRRCGDCDYGDNEDAEQTIKECADRHEIELEHAAMIARARSARP